MILKSVVIFHVVGLQQAMCFMEQMYMQNMQNPMAQAYFPPQPPPQPPFQIIYDHDGCKCSCDQCYKPKKCCRVVCKAQCPAPMPPTKPPVYYVPYPMPILVTKVVTMTPDVPSPPPPPPPPDIGMAPYRRPHQPYRIYGKRRAEDRPVRIRLEDLVIISKEDPDLSDEEEMSREILRKRLKKRKRAPEYFAETRTTTTTTTTTTIMTRIPGVTETRKMVFVALPRYGKHNLGRLVPFVKRYPYYQDEEFYYGDNIIEFEPRHSYRNHDINRRPPRSRMPPNIRQDHEVDEYNRNFYGENTLRIRPTKAIFDNPRG